MRPSETLSLSRVHLPADFSSVAAAFTAAQNGNATPTGASQQRISPRLETERALSPPERILHDNRALSPVTYHLHPPPEDLDLLNASGDYSSFSSLGNSSSSYSYTKEDMLVNQQRSASSRRAPRRSKAVEDEMAYRPAEDEGVASDSSGGGGDGVVRSGALDGRSATRGKRKAKGEGYLGDGLGIRPTLTRPTVRRGTRRDLDATEEDPSLNMSHSPSAMSRRSQRISVSPAPMTHPFTSPGVAYQDPLAGRPSRGPSAGRTMAANVTGGAAGFLAYVVQLGSSFIFSIIHLPKKLLRGARRGGNGALALAGIVLCLGLLLAARELSGNILRPAYRSSVAPPSNIDELVARLTSLETALAQASSTASGDLTAAQEAQRVLMKRIHELEHRQHLDDASGLETKGGVKEVQASVNQLKIEVSELQSRVSRHDEKLVDVDAEIGLVKSKIASVEEIVRRQLSEGHLRDVMLRIMPAKTPIEDGNIPPSVWAALKKVFVGADIVDEKIRGHFAAIQAPEPQWALEHHQEELNNWLLKAGHSLGYDKAAVINGIEGEVHALQSELKEIRKNVQSASSGRPAQPAVTFKSSKGEDVTEALHAIIDAALLKYSKDTIALADYALLSAGARVIPAGTSETLVLKRPSVFGQIVRGDRAITGRPPTTALETDTSVGSCWPFEGSKGTLGISLARPANIKAVTVEHAAKELALDVSSAPRDVEVVSLRDHTSQAVPNGQWASIEGEGNQDKVREWFAQREADGWIEE